MSITTDAVTCLGIKEMSQGKQLLRAFVDYANNRNVYKEEGYHSLDDYFKGRVEGIKSDTLYGRDGYSNVRYSYIGKNDGSQDLNNSTVFGNQRRRNLFGN